MHSTTTTKFKFFQVACVALASLLFLIPHHVSAWGSTGHAVVADLAMDLLSPAASKMAQTLLKGMSFAEASEWADTIRWKKGWKWTEPYHFINTPTWACNFRPQRDCPDQECVCAAISNYTQVLSQSRNGEETHQALLFLIHYIGDIHQPLHVGFLRDRGGAFIHVSFETHHGQTNSLHEVWDNQILHKTLSDSFNNQVNAYVSYLRKQLHSVWKDNITTWSQCPTSSSSSSSVSTSALVRNQREIHRTRGAEYVLSTNSNANDAEPLSCPEYWGDESAAVACEYAYKDSHGVHIWNGFDLQDEYYNFTRPIIDLQLTKAAVRLAATLNKLLHRA